MTDDLYAELRAELEVVRRDSRRWAALGFTAATLCLAKDYGRQLVALLVGKW